MKKRLPFVLVILLIVGLLGMMYLLQAAPEPRYNEPEAPAVTPEPLLTLIDQETAPAVSVTIDYEGTSQTYAYHAHTQAYEAVGYDARLAFDQTALKKLFGSCTRLVTRKVIDTEPKDLELYGMKEPACTVTAAYMNGKSHVIHVGARSPLADGYFGRVDDDPTVYLLSSYDADLFFKKPYDYRSYALFHELGDDAEAYALTVREILMESCERERIVFWRKPDGADGEVYPIQIKEPVAMNGDEYAFYQKVIQPIFSLQNARLSLVEDLPSDLGRYGLDSPQILGIRDDGGATRLLIGKEEDGRVYVMREGIPAVFSVKASAMVFFNLDYAQVMDRLVWLFNIDMVNSLRIRHSGGEDVLTVHENGSSFHFNGARADTETARTLYRNAISLQFDDRIAQSAADVAPECVLTIQTKDGKKHEIALHELNERHLEVVRDGVSTGFYVNKSDLQSIMSALKALHGET